ncbi:hypothetical protein FWC63_01225 [Candidatus Saccharibacteria bacterium]|nr:hypothetical protein [Candidatus Saccharibacteria bacterium]
MNPDDPNNTGESSYSPLGSTGDAASGGYAYGSADVVNNADYLSDISVAAPPKQSVWPKRIAIALGAVAALVAVIWIVMNAASDPRPGIATDAQLAYARAETLMTLSVNHRNAFNSTELRAVATELEMILGSFRSNLTVIMTANGVSRPRAPAAEEAFLEESTQTLQDARILMTLERTWVTIMTYELEMLRARLMQIEGSLVIIDHRQFMEGANHEIEGVRTRIGNVPIN